METHRRYLSIDILKGIGIIYMIILHQLIWLFIEADTGGLRFDAAKSVIINFAQTGLHVLAMQLPVLAGFTFFVFVKRKKCNWPFILKRAFFLLILGFLMNYLTWGVSYLPDTFDWDVLQFISLSMIITYFFMRFFPKRYGIMILTLLGAISFFLADKFPLGFLRKFYLYRIIIGDVWGQNYWPFFPWFSIFVLGVIIGNIYLGKDKKRMKIAIFTGVIALLISIFSGNFLPEVNLSNIWGPFIFKPSPLFVLGVIGFSLVSIPFLHFLFIHYPGIKNKFQNSIIIYYGKGILWIYLLSIIVFYHLTELIMSFFHLNFTKTLILLPFMVFIKLTFSYLIGKKVAYSKKIKY